LARLREWTELTITFHIAPFKTRLFAEKFQRRDANLVVLSDASTAMQLPTVQIVN
jgi:hypothetical protein